MQPLICCVKAWFRHNFSHPGNIGKPLVLLADFDGLYGQNLAPIMHMQNINMLFGKAGCNRQHAWRGQVLVCSLQCASCDANWVAMQYLEKDKTRGAVPRVMQKEAGQVQGGLRYLGQLFKQLQVGSLPPLPPCSSSTLPHFNLGLSSVQQLCWRACTS